MNFAEAVVPSKAGLRLVTIAVALTSAIEPPATASIMTGGDPARSCRIRVGKNFQVTDDPRGIAETYVAVNPKNAKNLIATAILGKLRGPQTVGFFFTNDGGQNWARPAVEGKAIKGKAGDGDPVVAFSRDGTAMLMTFRTGPQDGRPSNVLRRSTDGGRTVGPEDVVSTDLDHWMPGADHTSGRNGGNLYAFGYGGVSTVDGYHLDLLRSRTNGLDWSKRTLFTAREIFPDFSSSKPLQFQLQSMNNGVLVGSHGELILFFTTVESDYGLTNELGVPQGIKPDSYRVWISKSDDGGRHFNAPHQLTRADGSPLLSNFVNVRAAVAIDSSNGPYRGRVYLAWTDNTDPKRKTILLSYSPDNGRTWTEPRPSPLNTMTDADPSHDSPLPDLAVNNRGILLFAAYLNRVERESNSKPEVQGWLASQQRFVSASIDGGSTFLPMVPLASKRTYFRYSTIKLKDAQGKPKDIEFVSPDAKGNVASSIADYQNTVAGPDGTFHAVWMDGRTGTQQAWYANVSVSCIGDQPVSSRLRPTIFYSTSKMRSGSLRQRSEMRFRLLSSGELK